MSNAHEQVLLEVKDLRKYFPIRRGFLQKVVGYVRAVDGVTFYIDQGETMMTEGDLVIFDIDWAQFNQAAVKWAREYTFDLVGGLNDVSREALQESISAFFEQGWTTQELNSSLTPTFGPKRAESIAVTETTIAASEGEQETVRRLLEDNGIAMIPYWQTLNDELVCQICGPRNGKEIKPGNETNGEYPPAHPRCRCIVRHEIAG